MNVNIKHHLGWNGLHLAAVNGNSQILKILIEAGCDVNAGDEYINNYRTAHEKGLNTFEGFHFKFIHKNKKSSSSIETLWSASKTLVISKMLLHFISIPNKY